MRRALSIDETELRARAIPMWERPATTWRCCFRTPTGSAERRAAALRRAAGVSARQVLRPDHPQIAIEPQQPGADAAQGHEPAGRGRAVDAPRCSARRGRARTRPSKGGHQQPGTTTPPPTAGRGQPMMRRTLVIRSQPRETTDHPAPNRSGEPLCARGQELQVGPNHLRTSQRLRVDNTTPKPP